MKTSGLYVHIPFCKSKCRYCDFNSYAKMDWYISPYFSALFEEIKLMSKRYPQTYDTIYFGGGTPSLIEPSLICRTLTLIRECFHITDNAEITLECNPGTIDFEGLRSLNAAGINRLSIGLQSTCDNFLKTLGRIHTFNDFTECLSSARRAGFQNISVDLMYGLPDMTLCDWESTLRETAEFGVEHISCYSLKIEKGTPFWRMKLNLPDDDSVADMYDLAVSKLKEYGYNRYEISNFSKPGKESRHNLKYWQSHNFLGIGAGAFSCMEGIRFSNVLGISDYIAKIKSGDTAQAKTDVLDKFDLMSEFTFLGLRLADGISETEFESRFNLPIDQVFGEPLKKYTKMGFLIRENGIIRFSDKGFFVSNAILSDFV